MKPLSRPFVYAMLMLVMLFWAGNSIVARAMHTQIPPFTLTLGRWLGASAILLPFAARKLVADWPVIRSHWRVILFLGMIGVGSFNAFLYTGLRYTTASNALLIGAMSPALVLLCDLLIFRVRPNFTQVLGVTIAAAGVAIVIFKGDVSALLGLRFGFGDMLILCGACVWALYTVLLRIGPPVHPLSFLAVTFLIAVVMMLPLAVLEWQSWTIRFTVHVAASFAYVAVLPSLVSYLLFNRAVQEIGAAAASQTLSLQPLFGAFLAAALLGEELHRYHFTGMALILLGIAVPLALRSRAA